MEKIKQILKFTNKIFRYGWFPPFVNLLGIYGGGIIPSRYMQKLSNLRHRVLESKISEIVDIKELVIETETNKVKPKLKFDTLPIWYFWMQGEDKMPSIPRICLKSIRKNAGKHPVIIITKENIKDFVDIPKRILMLFEKGVITATHFSDILRMALLSEYGGLWVDATMYITKPISESIFSMPLFTVKNPERPTNFVSRFRWTGFCMASQPGGILPTFVRNLFYRYWSKEDILIDYFLIDYAIDLGYNNMPEIRSQIDQIEISNPEIHELSSMLCNDYDDKEYKRLLKSTSLFKLNWKKYTEEELKMNPLSFFEKLKKEAD